ncbi:unnamed protein product [Rotaria sp. Silwood2]|nr:unnamed protein product [Rotaria sp. Silwood2]CAF2948033.1 unnamed protein product [Rotaria sp. Silwood2]CAF2952246.1 unnamed protein product [Rotaria sp. Silwood2]CAF3348296.1 unnamed protein product [Rotaria sp. Silwood2]CAF3943847.1 unnamed protein product [Rotaria sp. Silwood2]
MNTEIGNNHQLNQNPRNSTNKGTAQRQMHFYNNSRISQNNIRGSPSTFKRHLTNYSTLGDDARYSNNKRQRQNSQDNAEEIYDNDERIGEWIDPNVHHGFTFNDKQADNDRSQTLISKQAINYATDCHYPPIKIICTPKIQIQNQNGSHFVQTLIKHIEKKFKNENPTCNKLLAFEAWWVNAEGDMMILTKCMEIFIHLCILSNYPHEINTIKIEPQLPKYLPPPFSVLIKFVHNHISIDEIRQEVKGKYSSQYSCNELIGTKTNRTRHVRIDFTERNDYNSILKNGQISFLSQLYTVNEFLEAPKLLICSKCNTPGHMKRQCQLNYDRCRRCGGDRITGDHNECTIKCHHCSGEHVSTDYKCPTLADYRCELVKELKRHPEHLPEHVQLFIPAQCRDRNDRSHIIANYQKNEQKSRSTFNSTFNMNSHVWPQPIPSSHTTNNETIITQNINEEIKLMREDFNKELNKLNAKYEKQLKDSQDRWYIVAQQIKTQNEMINSMSATTLSCIFPIGIDLLRTTSEAIKSLHNNEQNEETKIKLNESAEKLHLQMNKLSEHFHILQQYQEKMSLLMKKQTTSLMEAMKSPSHDNE